MNKKVKYWIFLIILKSQLCPLVGLLGILNYYYNKLHSAPLNVLFCHPKRKDIHFDMV